MTIKFVPSDIPIYLTALESTVERLEKLSNQKEERELAKSSSTGEWSIKEILAHLEGDHGASFVGVEGGTEVIDVEKASSEQKAERSLESSERSEDN